MNGTERFEHLILLMIENRCFDHALGSLSHEVAVPREGVAGAWPHLME